jgi:hypothetical protein
MYSITHDAPMCTHYECPRSFSLAETVNTIESGTIPSGFVRFDGGLLIQFIINCWRRNLQPPVTADMQSETQLFVSLRMRQTSCPTLELYWD